MSLVFTYKQKISTDMYKGLYIIVKFYEEPNLKTELLDNKCWNTYFRLSLYYYL